jgi:multiple sugar transport system permease protein
MTARRVLYVAAIVVLCAWVLVPIYLVAIGAMGGRPAVFRWPKEFWPSAMAADHLLLFLRIEGVWRATVNSALVAALTMALALALGAPAGYALARFAFAGADGFRLLVLLTRAFPLAMLALPLAVLYIRIGLYDTPFGVCLVHTALALPFVALVTSSLFVAIPRELEEAAWIFGCTRLQGFIRVVVPIAAPGLVASAVFAFVISWNEVFAASVLTVRERTLTAYLLAVLSESPLHYRFAGALALILPSVAFLFAVRRYLFSMWGLSSR